MTAFLNVTTSLTGKYWRGPSLEQSRLAETITQQTGQPPLLAQILAQRGVLPENVASFLEPTLRDLMPDPSTLNDMGCAAARFTQALHNTEKIAIFADYDVDGGASAALLLTWLRDIGHTATLYIPDRIDEGYGPNEAAMASLGATHDLIVCVDCGTLSHAPIKAANCDIIVLDHHLGGETLPDAIVVNPNRQDESGEHGYLCAAGVVFLFLVALNRLRRAENQSQPSLISLLDLVALSTVADVAPLIGLNRAFVRQGLKIMATRQRPGLAALADVAKLTTAPTSYHLGFILGPRVNAGGRIGVAELGARLLATNDPTEAAHLAQRLDHLNTERRAIEAEVLASALAQSEQRGQDGPLAWAAGDGWHPGVVGIVAARLKEATHRPAIVIGFDGENGKGSGRSISGIDLGSAIATLQREGLIEKGGGHKMAAGLSLTKPQLEPAMQRLAELLAKQGSGAQPVRDLHIDGLLANAAATPELLEQLEKAGPFGQEAPAPRVAFASQHITFAKRAGNTHLRLTLSDGTAKLDAIMFRAFETPIGSQLENHDGQPFHFAGRLELDDWQGRRKAKLRIEDVAKAT